MPHLAKPWMQDVLVGLNDEIRLFPFTPEQKREASQAISDLSFLFLETAEADKHWRVVSEIFDLDFELIEGRDIEDLIIERQNETAG